jgi:hypothetical protein
MSTTYLQDPQCATTTYLQDPQCVSTVHHTCRIVGMSAVLHHAHRVQCVPVRHMCRLHNDIIMCKYPQDTAFEYSTPYA